jgi:hypothetical protein
MKYFDSELNSISEPLLTLFRSEDMGVTWEKLNSSWPSTASNAVSASGVNAFSDWTLGSADEPLPVSLLHFRGRIAGPSAILTWQTTAETDNLGFEVQRSDDGRAYRKIGFVEAISPEGRISGAYTFTDREFPGMAYYRLRQLDRNGTGSSSPTILLDRKTGVKTEVSIFPNPAGHDGATLQLSGLDGSVTLSVTDVAGRHMATLQGDSHQASEAFRRLTAGMEAGFYLVRLQADGFTKTLKFEKR